MSMVDRFLPLMEYITSVSARTVEYADAGTRRSYEVSNKK